MFKGFSKLLICGGEITGKQDADTCEIIRLESSAKTCKNPTNFPTTFFAAIGGMGFRGNPIICGGRQNDTNSNTCYSLENNEWVFYSNMSSARNAAAAAQLQDGNLLVTGGVGEYGSFLETAEMLTDMGWERKIPPLPVSIYAHCMVAVNSSTVMVIGGVQSSQYSGKSYYFTFGQTSWTKGPELKHKRYLHSCGRIKRDKDSQETSTIVAGGWDESSNLSSVEILDEGSIEWRSGPELPFGIDNSQMVEDQKGGVVLIGGYSPANPNLDTLYQLPHAGKDALWTKVEQNFKTGRKGHTAFFVPDTISVCS